MGTSFLPVDTSVSLTAGARRAVRAIAALVAVAVMVGTGVAWGKIRSFEGGINHISAASLGGGGEDGAIDILLVGMDSRTDAHGNPLSAEELATLRAGDDVSTNTDTIILVRIPNNGKSATAISIPRDSYVDAGALGKTKINGVFGQVKLDRMKELVENEGMDPARAEPQATEAGREALIKTVANLTGVTVDHYAEIGLLGFSLITDALGGVDVCLKDAVYEPLSGADFPAGWQKLNGPQALSFVRQRQDLPRGDLDRVVRQQAVMASLAHQVISSKTLSSPATLNRLEEAVQRSVVLSDGWDIMDFVNQLQKLAAGNVAFATIPVLDEAGWSDDGMQSVVRVDPTQVQDWVKSLLDNQAKGKTEQLAYTPAKTTADVVNDSDIGGLAASVSQVLSAKGFVAGNIGNNVGGHVTNSQVQAAKADDLGAQAVSKELGGLPVVADATLVPGTVRVVLSSDYTGPGSGLQGGDPAVPSGDTLATEGSVPTQGSTAPPPSPILTAGSNDPECVN
ncbi:MAG: LytR family transcriptional regulator [Mycobacterium sp.]|nr:LytR family transcriptional regulator [Mycobacterium sp.]